MCVPVYDDFAVILLDFCGTYVTYNPSRDFNKVSNCIYGIHRPI